MSMNTQTGQLARTAVGETAGYTNVLYIGKVNEWGRCDIPDGLEGVLKEHGCILMVAHDQFNAGMQIGLHRPRCVIIDREIGVWTEDWIVRSIRKEKAFRATRLILLAAGNRLGGKGLHDFAMLKQPFDPDAFGRYIATIFSSDKTV